MTDPSCFHAYSNGTDTLFGTSWREALGEYLNEINTKPEDFSEINDEWVPLDDNQALKIFDEDSGATITKTVREWIDEQAVPNQHGWFSRMICSTEY